MVTDQQNIKPHYFGHRQRLKKRFLKNEGRSLPDYELLELLLTYAIPRRDVKPEAKHLVEKFGSLASLIGVPQTKLFQNSLTFNQVVLLKLVHTIAVRLGLKHFKESDRIILKDFDSLADYCRMCVGNKKIEEFHAIFLNSSLELIKDELIEGVAADDPAVFAEKIVKRAVASNAVTVVFYHNHPIKTVMPSDDDIKLTKEIMLALKTVDVDLSDHLIIAENNMYSFREMHKLKAFKSELDAFYERSVKD